MLRKTTILLTMVSVLLWGCNTSGTENTPEQPSLTSETASGDDHDSETGAIHITKADFIEKVMDYETNTQEWVYKGDRPCLIDFYADWCGPCKTASPILEELAVEFKDKIYIYKVDTEVERELSSVFGIRSIPSFLFCPSEGRPTMSNGIARTPEETKEMFRQMINDILLEENNTQSL